MIEYLNTDLVVAADMSIDILDKAFKDAGLHALGIFPPGIRGMGYETEEQYDAPEHNIMAFLSIIESLDKTALKIWNMCERREFDIGYRGDTKPRSFIQTLSPELLKRIAAVNAGLKITLYATELP